MPRLLGIHWVHNKGWHLCLVPIIASCHPFCLIWLLLVTLLALDLLRCEFADQAPKGEAMARVTFATAFGHPLGPQQRLTSVFGPYHRVVPPILFDLGLLLVTLLALPLLRGENIFFSAQRRSNGPRDICHGCWASIGSTTKAGICVWSLSSRRATHFV